MGSAMEATPVFDKYRRYVEEECLEWSKQNAETILPSIHLPMYSRTDRMVNEMRAMAGKWFFKAATGMSKGLRDLGLWPMISRLGVHTWNQVFLPGYKPHSRPLDPSFISSASRLLDTGMTGFEAWRARQHPDCTMKEAEQASRLVVFGLMWALMEGRRELAPAELEALWAYAMMYPLVDNTLDDHPTMPEYERRAFVRDLQEAVREGVVTMNMFAGHPKRQSLLTAMATVRHALLSKGLLASSEAFSALEILTVIEMQPDPSNESDKLFRACMQGGMAMIPAVMLVSSRAVGSEEYRRIFRYGLAAQLVDDLQDVEQDRRAGRQTLFTVTDPVVAIKKTINYLAHEGSVPAGTTEMDWLQRAVTRMTCYGAMEAVVLSPMCQMLPHGLVKELKGRCPFGRKFMERHRAEPTLYRAMNR